MTFNPQMFTSFLVVAITMTGCYLRGVVEHESECVNNDIYSEVRIQTVSGDVEVVSGDITRIDSTIRYTNGRRPMIDIFVEGDTLTIQHACPAGIGVCSVDFTVTLPEDKALWIQSTSGNVQSDGMASSIDVQVTSGNVDLTDHTGGMDIDAVSGNITLTDVSGDILAQSTSGNVRGAAIDSQDITAYSTSGNTTFRMVSAPANVMIESTSGNVNLTVPEEDYNFCLRATSGSVSLDGLSDVDAAERFIEVGTTSGNITISAR
jgi:DUF4097 and DUF4098 domain-containing protein YvlB